jgi:hypothetical protein
MVLNQCFDYLLCEKLRRKTLLQVVDQLILRRLFHLQEDQSDTCNHQSYLYVEILKLKFGL